MSLHLWALQKTVYAALSNDAAVLAALGGPNVFDDPPHASKSAPWPRVVFGPARATDAGTQDADAVAIEFDVVVWSRAGGRREALDVADAVCGALHDSDLASEEACIVSLRRLRADVRRGGDGETWSATLRFRAFVEAG